MEMANSKANVAMIVTVVVLGAAAILGAVMIMNIGASEQVWSRYAYLLTGVEAILFAAVGWLFGKEVHREEAQTAEAKRSEAESEARHATADAATEAEKGRGLAHAVIAAASGQAEAEELEAAPAEGQTPARPAVAAAMVGLAAHARSLYPDL
jgi:hypothetical protein